MYFLFCGLLLCVGFLATCLHRRRPFLPLPPGPKGLPFIGNTHQIPDPAFAWRTYDAWMQQYGPIIYVNVAGIDIIVVGKDEIARGLLAKQGDIYSGRPRMVMAGELATKGLHMLLRPFDERYKLHQRLHSGFLSQRASSNHQNVQDMESTKVLLDFLAAQDQMPTFAHNFERYSASIITRVLYGYRLPTGGEPHFVRARKIQKEFQKFGTPGKYLVDAFPALKALPGFLAPWKREAEQSFRLESAVHMENLDYGISNPHQTFSKILMSNNAANQMDRVELAYTLGTVADAALETTSMQLEWFILACCLFPEKMAKGRAEIDELVGRTRMPEFSDMDSLPYLSAIFNETLRWRTIAAGGIPHSADVENSYRGYRIPKNSIILPIYHTINRDPEVYGEPETFLPERWLENPNMELPAAFGYGRRICTGRHIARNSLFIIMVRTLWGFNVKRPIDTRTGKESLLDPDAMTAGFTFGPKPFKAVFEPRGPWVDDIVQRRWQSFEKDL